MLRRQFWPALLALLAMPKTLIAARRSKDAPAVEEVEAALQDGDFKLMTITHVDTSTAVAADVQSLAALGQQHGVLVVVDGVCAVAGEEMRQEEWGIDLALTASQKAIGVPPGLALIVAGPRAMETYRQRERPAGSFYADWEQWLPIMEAYEARRPSYFGTPPVNLIWALNISLAQILAEGIEARFARHQRLNRAVKSAVAALGLKQVPVSPERGAVTLTAAYYPDGVDSALLGQIGSAGVILAGGLHPAIKDRYFRIGHMGAVNESDVLATVGAIETGLILAGSEIEPGTGLAAAQAAVADPA